MLEQGASRV